MSDALWLDALLVMALLGVITLIARNARAFLPTLVGQVRSFPRYYPALARQAGLRSEELFPFYWLLKIFLALSIPMLLGELLGRPAGLAEALLLAVTGFVLPDLFIWLRRRARQRRIVQALSYFLDLLVALLRSGLGLEEAFRRAGRYGFAGPHPLAEEISRIGEEIAVGRDRGVAFRALAERTGVPDLHAVAAALELSSRVGMPVGESLSAQADLQREKRLERGRRRINNAAVLALFPVFLCGYPLFLVLVLFPTFLDLLGTLRFFAALFS